MHLSRFKLTLLIGSLLILLGTTEAFAGRRFFHRRQCAPPTPCYCEPRDLYERAVTLPVPDALLLKQAETWATQLPYVADKPKPRSSTFNGCPPRGDETKGDQDLNFLKNRIDVPEGWIQVGFTSVLNQPFPKTVGKRHRDKWDDDDLAEVRRFEGLPISIVCYVAGAQDEGPESCNCYIKDKSMYDIHIWLTEEPVEEKDRRRAVVAEVTPRLKVDHPSWTQTAFRKLAKQEKKVRVSGWLLLDQEHPEQLNKTRGTLWEIHPIMEVEVWENGKWVPLDDLESMAEPLVDRQAA